MGVPARALRLFALLVSMLSRADCSLVHDTHGPNHGSWTCLTIINILKMQVCAVVAAAARSGAIPRKQLPDGAVSAGGQQQHLFRAGAAGSTGAEAAADQVGGAAGAGGDSISVQGQLYAAANSEAGSRNVQAAKPAAQSAAGQQSAAAAQQRGGAAAQQPAAEQPQAAAENAGGQSAATTAAAGAPGAGIGSANGAAGSGGGGGGGKAGSSEAAAGAGGKASGGGGKDSAAKAAADAGGTTAAAGAVGGKAMPMYNCSTDDSGLSLASLKVEAAWESHGLREGTDMTIVTQMSPRRRAGCFAPPCEAANMLRNIFAACMRTCQRGPVM